MGIRFALDGEVSVYTSAEMYSEKPQEIFTLKHGALDLNPHFKGNIALLDTASETLFLAAECSGTFPLYYHLGGYGQLAFCSRQRPMAKLLRLSYDPIGILEFARSGYTFEARTFFRGLRRLSSTSPRCDSRLEARRDGTDTPCPSIDGPPSMLIWSPI